MSADDPTARGLESADRALKRLVAALASPAAEAADGAEEDAADQDGLAAGETPWGDSGGGGGGRQPQQQQQPLAPGAPPVADLAAASPEAAALLSAAAQAVHQALHNSPPSAIAAPPPAQAAAAAPGASAARAGHFCPPRLLSASFDPVRVSASHACTAAARRVSLRASLALSDGAAAAYPDTEYDFVLRARLSGGLEAATACGAAEAPVPFNRPGGGAAAAPDPVQVTLELRSAAFCQSAVHLAVYAVPKSAGAGGAGSSPNKQRRAAALLETAGHDDGAADDAASAAAEGVALHRCAAYAIPLSDLIAPDPVPPEQFWAEWPELAAKAPPLRLSADARAGVAAGGDGGGLLLPPPLAPLAQVSAEGDAAVGAQQAAYAGRTWWGQRVRVVAAAAAVAPGTLRLSVRVRDVSCALSGISHARHRQETAQNAPSLPCTRVRPFRICDI